MQGTNTYLSTYLRSVYLPIRSGSQGSYPGIMEVQVAALLLRISDGGGDAGRRGRKLGKLAGNRALAQQPASTNEKSEKTKVRQRQGRSRGRQAGQAWQAQAWHDPLQKKEQQMRKKQRRRRQRLQRQLRHRRQQRQRRLYPVRQTTHSHWRLPLPPPPSSPAMAGSIQLSGSRTTHGKETILLKCQPDRHLTDRAFVPN